MVQIDSTPYTLFANPPDMFSPISEGAPSCVVGPPRQFTERGRGPRPLPLPLLAKLSNALAIILALPWGICSLLHKLLLLAAIFKLCV